MSAIHSRLKEISFQLGQFVQGLISGDMRELKRLAKKNSEVVDAILAEKKKSLEQCPVTGEIGTCPVKDCRALRPERWTYLLL